MYRLGIIIPYLNNSSVAEELFSILKAKLRKQILKYNQHLDNDDVVCMCYEDNKEKPNGLSHQRNLGLNDLINMCKYILFLDADDDISDDYVDKMLEATNSNYELLESRFFIRNKEIPFEPNVVKNHVTGIAYRSDIIDSKRFDERIQVGEDEDFNKRVVDLTIMRKFPVDCCYYYNLGLNRESLTMKFNRGEIRKEKGD